MRKIKVKLTIGIGNAFHTGTIEVEDEATDEDIQDAADQWANNYIDVSWSE